MRQVGTAEARGARGQGQEDILRICCREGGSSAEARGEERMSGVKMEEMGPLLRRGGDALQVEGAARVGSWMVRGLLGK